MAAACGCKTCTKRGVSCCTLPGDDAVIVGDPGSSYAATRPQTSPHLAILFRSQTPTPLQAATSTSLSHCLGQGTSTSTDTPPMSPHDVHVRYPIWWVQNDAPSLVRSVSSTYTAMAGRRQRHTAARAISHLPSINIINARLDMNLSICQSPTSPHPQPRCPTAHHEYLGSSARPGAPCAAANVSLASLRELSTTWNTRLKS